MAQDPTARVYIPELKGTVTFDEATQLSALQGQGIPLEEAARQLRIASPERGPTLGFQAGDESAGFELPPGVPGIEDEIRQALKAVPQLAGLVASFTPVGRAMKGAVGIPAMASAGTQMATEGEVDPAEAMGEGLLGGAFRGVGKGIEKVGQMGEGAIRRALFGGGSRMPSSVDEAALPKLAAQMKARMVRETPATPISSAGPRISGSAQDVRRRSAEPFKQSVKLDQGHLPKPQRNPQLQKQADLLEAKGDMTKRLADQIEVADQAYRTRAGILPQILAGGGMTGVAGAALGAPAQATAAISPLVGASTSVAPMRMAIGSALTRPFGVSTEETISPAVERLLRLLTTANTAAQEPEMQTSRGPRRRRGGSE